MQRRPVVGDRRGGSLVEILILVALLALGALAAFGYFGQRANDTAVAKAACVESLSANCGVGATTPGGTGDGTTAGTGQAANAATSDDGGGKGFFGTAWDWTKKGVGWAWGAVKGFAVDGLWGDLKGLWELVTDPWGTLKGLGHLASVAFRGSPILFMGAPIPNPFYDPAAGEELAAIGSALWESIKEYATQNPDRAVGRLAYEIATFVIAPAKLLKVTKAKYLAKLAKAEKLADAAKVLDKTADAAKVVDAMSPGLKAALKAKMAKLGLDTSDDALKALMKIDDGIPDSAVGKLKREILSDPKRAAEVEAALAKMSDEALAAGVTHPELAALRLEMLSMALPESTRPALMAAIRSDLATMSGKTADFLAANPNTKFKRVIIGGGPQGQTIANRLHHHGDGTSTLVIDAAKGDGSFGSIRKFDLNSSSGKYDGINGAPMKGRSQNPLHGSPVQVDDITPDGKPFPYAGDMGDASQIGLYGAMRRGTDVMTDTKVTNIIKDPGTGTAWPGKYRVDMTDAKGRTISVYTDEKPIIASGLGKSALPRDPGTRAFAQSEIAKMADNPEALKDVRVITGEDLLRGSNHVKDEAAFYTNADGPTYFIGSGDAAKTAVEHFGKVTNAGTRPEAYWVGVKPDDLKPVRYTKAKDLVESGVVQPTSGRLSRIEPIEGSRNVRLVFEDGTTKEAGKVVTAMGMDSEVPGMVKGIAPDYNPKTSLKPVKGTDPVYPDQTLAQTINDDAYVVGIAGSTDRPAGVSFLQYWGHKNVEFTDQVLVGRGPPQPSPVTGVRKP